MKTLDEAVEAVTPGGADFSDLQKVDIVQLSFDVKANETISGLMLANWEEFNRDAVSIHAVPEAFKASIYAALHLGIMIGMEMEKP